MLVIIIDVASELMILIFNKFYFLYDETGVCLPFSNNIFHLILFICLIQAYIIILIFLHLSIKQYFIANPFKFDYQKYKNSIALFYTSFILSFPHSLIYSCYTIFNTFIIQSKVKIFMIVFVIIYQLFILISSLIFCMNMKKWNQIKEMCGKKKSVLQMLSLKQFKV